MTRQRPVPIGARSRLRLPQTGRRARRVAPGALFRADAVPGGIAAQAHLWIARIAKTAAASQAGCLPEGRNRDSARTGTTSHDVGRIALPQRNLPLAPEAVA